MKATYEGPHGSKNKLLLFWPVLKLIAKIVNKRPELSDIKNNTKKFGGTLFGGEKLLSGEATLCRFFPGLPRFETCGDSARIFLTFSSLYNPMRINMTLVLFKGTQTQ